MSASTSMTFDAYVKCIGDARLVFDMLVGALQRMLSYPAQGFTIDMAVPVDVAEAYERLRSAGFIGRLV